MTLQNPNPNANANASTGPAPAARLSATARPDKQPELLRCGAESEHWRLASCLPRSCVRTRARRSFIRQGALLCPGLRAGAVRRSGRLYALVAAVLLSLNKSGEQRGHSAGRCIAAVRSLAPRSRRSSFAIVSDGVGGGRGRGGRGGEACEVCGRPDLLCGHDCARAGYGAMDDTGIVFPESAVTVSSKLHSAQSSLLSATPEALAA